MIPKHTLFTTTIWLIFTYPTIAIGQNDIRYQYFEPQGYGMHLIFPLPPSFIIGNTPQEVCNTYVGTVVAFGSIWTNGIAKQEDPLQRWSCNDTRLYYLSSPIQSLCQVNSAPLETGSPFARPTYDLQNNNHDICVCPIDAPFDPAVQWCVYQYYHLTDTTQAGCNKEANPCDVVTGRKTQTETDIDLSHFRFDRHYDSGTSDPVPWIGPHWRHSFDTTLNKIITTRADFANPIAEVAVSRYITTRSRAYTGKAQACIFGWQRMKSRIYRGLFIDAIAEYNWETQLCDLYQDGQRVHSLPLVASSAFQLTPVVHDTTALSISRPNGAMYTFEPFKGGYREISGYSARLTREGDDYLFYDTDGTIDRFVNYKMVERTLPNKKILTLTYTDVGWLDSVSDAFGQTLQFRYNNNGQIDRVSHPNGIIRYNYDTNYNLISVTYEDDSTRRYHYEDTRHTHHLTGITDERGIRYSSWTYDHEGKALSSFHAGDIDKTTFEYTDTSTIVTDPMGATREYHLGVRNNELVVTSVTGDRCMDCWKGGAAEREYDDNGHISQETDWEGNVTTYIHNDRGQELSRTEASGTPQARTITTEWHPTFNLPTSITEPNRKINMSYDTKGRLLSREVIDQ